MCFGFMEMLQLQWEQTPILQEPTIRTDALIGLMYMELLVKRINYTLKMSYTLGSIGILK